MTHPNAMVAWDEIACRRACGEHTLRRVRVDLGRRHRYGDFAQVPRPLARRFEMFVYDPDVYPVDGGPYCPAHDAVSATIVSHRIWEPRETILALHVLSTAGEGQVFYDFGAQLGWYSLLAASCGVRVDAFEADRDNVAALRTSVRANHASSLVGVIHTRIGEGFDLRVLAGDRIRLAKFDLEGAESFAVDALWPQISAGAVDHMLVEVSPVFGPGYPDLVARIIGAGYDAYMLPPRRSPPVSLDRPDALEPYRMDAPTVRQTVAGWHQEDVWFKRREVAW